MERLKTKAKAAGLWNMFLPESHLGAGLSNLEEVRPAVRDHGPLAADGRGDELFRPRHRQHGGADALRHAGPAGALAEAAAGRRDPLGIRDDRAGLGLVGRDADPVPHRAPGRRLRDQRPQVVDQRRDGPALPDPDPDGQDRPRGRHLPPAIDDPGAQGHPGRQHRTRAVGVRLRPRPREAHAEVTFTNVARAGVQPAAG